MDTVALSLDFKRLEQLYAAGLQDSFVEAAIRKIVSHQIERDQADLARINDWLAEFEAKYHMKSDQFWRQFKAGQTEDSADYMEWNALCRSRERLLSRLRILRGEDSNA